MRASADRPDPVPVLAPREREVLRLLVHGLVISEIARALFISESTAKTHVANLYEKLRAGNRSQAVLAATRLGLLDDEGGGAAVPARPGPRPPALPPRAAAAEPPAPPPPEEWPPGFGRPAPYR